MIIQRRNIFAMTVILIVVFGLWMSDRYHLARKVKEERLRAKEQLAEKEVELKKMEEKLSAGQKELERLRLEKTGGLKENAQLEQVEVLKKIQELEQQYKEQEYGAKQAEPKTQTEQNLLDKESQEIQPIKEEGGLKQEEAIKTEQEEQGQPQP